MLCKDLMVVVGSLPVKAEQGRFVGFVSAL